MSDRARRPRFWGPASVCLAVGVRSSRHSGRPEVVNVKVAKRKNVSRNSTHGEPRLVPEQRRRPRRSGKRYSACLNMLGRKSRNPTVAYKTTAVATMHRSRLNTRTVYFQGIFLTKESTRNNELSNSLSAIGSRYCPSMSVAYAPAPAAVESVAEASPIRSPSAQSQFPSNTVMMTTG